MPLLEQGYIDVSTSYDAFAQSSGLVSVIIAIAEGRVTTPKNAGPRPTSSRAYSRSE